ncbi:MAG: bifunctional DNA-formamidopyrimidine glycosylase/DNA-(apurinic or apyrimidinic site) lyase [Acidimicrobiales bacterium]|jgi:formamidopyrimidine-DNA glycosylase|nr:bifunctional DNA-formamidopyrimidine glycosylase/DNA-(apurinic or apyrimidinic site) lyase [Acidimicrobiales bacterium]
MPELPEVETIRRELDREVVGRKIKAVEVSGARSVRRHTNRKQFVEHLTDTKITGVERRGKYLVVKLDSGELLVIHLGMSGQLLRAQPKEPLAKHTHVVITFNQGGQLRFVDPRTFGELFVTAPDELTAQAPELAELGIDPVDEPMSWQDFGRMLLRQDTKLKAFLMDQHNLAGIGNIYSDEILFAAGLRYDRSTRSLSSQEMRRLYRSVVEILHEAIKYGGSTLDDEQYVNLSGKPGEYQHHHNVYARERQPCPRCRTPIVKVKFQGRSAFFCERCQV